MYPLSELIGGILCLFIIEHAYIKIRDIVEGDMYSREIIILLENRQSKQKPTLLCPFATKLLPLLSPT